ncbi:LamG domain-containing protein [Draconibacterium sp.]|nr:LamG domain-containing protein [Draconibacterium sp.]
MKTLFRFVLSLFILTQFSCDSSSDKEKNPYLELGEFGAFYTRIKSNEAFEEYARVREHPDIIVDLGKANLTFNFWRGSSYLPYLESPKGRWYVDEVIERKGDGSDRMPDRTNAYSHVKIISDSEETVVIHWRYLPVFEGGNPQKGVAPDKFVDEYFFINRNGEVKRTIKKGTEQIDDWKNPANIQVQTFRLTKGGIRDIQLTKGSNGSSATITEGNPIIDLKLNPVAWWKFDEGTANKTQESVSKFSSEVAGSKALWRKGVSGTALQFDGYFSEIVLPAEHTPKVKEAITLEGWIAIGAYPWNEVPVVQQLDDSPEELVANKGKDAGTDFQLVLKKENDKGYFLGIDGYGNPVFKINIDGELQQLKADYVLNRRTWYHLVASYSKETGLMKIYVNGEKVGQKKVEMKYIEPSDSNVRIGKGKDRRPIRPVRRNTFADSYSFDGLIDEVKIYDISISEEQVAAAYNSVNANAGYFARVDMDGRIFPEGENRKSFGAYYTKLNFYDVYDNLWRISEHPDVVVEFDDNPGKFIFWRATGYIPMMANDKGQWYSNEFNETWGTSGGNGCQEPMSDKEAYTNYVRIIENTPARTIVQWRYPLLDVNHVMANYNESTGWCDWSDWYYYIYPDGVAVKSMKLWTDGERNHEWQESMAIMGPDQHPEEIIHTRGALTMLNLKNESKTYDWINEPPKNVDEPNGQCIQYINYTGQYKPVTIGNFISSDVYNGEVTDYSVFPTWNHWPIAQMPSDGRYAIYPDRTAHSSLTHLRTDIFREEKKGPTPFYQKILMEAMLDKEFDELVLLAKSWLNAPQIVDLKGAEGEYAADQRAYLLYKKENEISFTIDADMERPLVNAAFIIKNWNSSTPANLKLNGNPKSNKQGIFRDTNGAKTLAIWVELTGYEKTDFIIY